MYPPLSPSVTCAANMVETPESGTSPPKAAAAVPEAPSATLFERSCHRGGGELRSSFKLQQGCPQRNSFRLRARAVLKALQ